VAQGESLGIIGINGSGKSTLLKILSGALHPTSGQFTIASGEGRVLSLLELGTGLNMELTGRANVFNSARLLGFPDAYPREKMADIAAFAELGDFFDRPVRLYSSGMLVRLVFSMFACFDPEVFIVDEALSVGDVYFQQKCARRIRELLDRGVTMLFVSHDLAAVDALCDRVLVLHQGQAKFLGDKRRGIAMYYSLVGASLPPSTAAAAIRRAPPPAEEQSDGAEDVELADLQWQQPDGSDEAGDGRVRILAVAFRDPEGEPNATAHRGEWLDIFVHYQAKSDVGPMSAAIQLHDRLNQLLFAVNWLNAELEPIWLGSGEQAIARFSVKADLEPGEYILSLASSQALADPQSPTGWNQNLGGERFVYLPRAAKIAVTPAKDGRRKSFGPAALQYRITRTTRHFAGLA
jgi:ABC-type polysaccharide/polyol phosphate transport system ATPase subunit